MDFNYRIIVKEKFVVVTMKGKLTRANKDVLVNCEKEIGSLENHTVIFVFKDFLGVEQPAYRELTILQQNIRKSNKLFLVGLSHIQKQELGDRGIIRLGEVRNTLEEILSPN